MAGYAIVPDIESPELTGTDIAVWTALCHFAQWEFEDKKPIRSKPGTCYPRQDQLAQKAHITDRAVRKSLNHLEALGYIYREAVDRERGQFKSTGYILLPNGGTIGTTFLRPEEPRSYDHRNNIPTAIGTTFLRPEEPRSYDHRNDVPTNNINNNNPKEQYKEKVTLLDIDLHNTLSGIAAEEKPAAAEAPDRVSLNQVTKLWNDRLGPLGFPMVMKETPARKRAFQARVNEAPERRTLAWWKGLISRVEGAEFLRDSAQQKAGWLNFDWLLNENNLVKVLEGRYDGRETPWTRGRDSPQKAPPPATWEEAVKQYRQRHGFDRGGEDDAEAGFVKVS